jgi:hypothetical protein
VTAVSVALRPHGVARLTADALGAGESLVFTRVEAGVGVDSFETSALVSDDFVSPGVATSWQVQVASATGLVSLSDVACPAVPVSATPSALIVDGLAWDGWGWVAPGGLTLTPPQPRLAQVDVEGRDGLLDLSEALGAVRWHDRSTGFVLTREENAGRAGWQAVKKASDDLVRLWHGRRAAVRMRGWGGWHLEGRMVFDAASQTEWGEASELAFDLVGCPWRLRNTLTRVVVAAGTNKAFTLPAVGAAGMGATPLFARSGAATVKVGSSQWSVSAGSSALSGLRLVPGEASKAGTVTATAATVFSWREGRI